MVRAAESKPARRAPLAGARVLVVDDHSFTIGLIREALFAGGAASVRSANDGHQAIAMLQTFRPNLLVTDWHMPGMNGLVLTRTVREAVFLPDPRISNPRLPIVLVSAHTSARAVAEARQVGVDEVVVKPFSMTSLLKRIAAAANKPRPFVVADGYAGPDRRRKRAGTAKGRRVDDQKAGAAETDAGDACFGVFSR
jgi:CheY-like chemotaxis protein